MEKKFLSLVLAFEFPLHAQSAFNPSIFTIKKFKESVEDKKNLLKGLYITLGLNLLFSVAMWLYDKEAGLVAFVISISVFIYYYNLVIK